MISTNHSFCRLSTVVAMALLAAGCASSRGDIAGASRGCNPTIDEKFLANGPVFAPCQVDEQARPVASPRVALAGDMRSEGPGCTSAEVEFVVDADGNPRLDYIRTVRATSVQLATRVREAVPMMRYTPARKDGRAVSQVVRFRVATQTVAVRAGSGRPAPPRMPTSC